MRESLGPKASRLRKQHPLGPRLATVTVTGFLRTVDQQF